MSSYFLIIYSWVYLIWWWWWYFWTATKGFSLDRGGDLNAIICHFLSFHMEPSVLYGSLVIQDRIKKNFWKKIIFKPLFAPQSIWSFLEGETVPNERKYNSTKTAEDPSSPEKQVECVIDYASLLLSESWPLFDCG